MSGKNQTVRTVSLKKAAVVLLLAMLLPTILLQGVFMLMYVPSESMAPTLSSGDILLGSRMVSEPKRGDIVVFQKDNTLLIKRVVGLPGETVEIGTEGEIFINGEPQDEPYVVYQRKGQKQIFQVPEGHYLLLGDNRQHSYDARYWDEPYVAEDAIQAVVIKKFFSIPHIWSKGDLS